MKTKIEIIEETANYYNTNNRSLSDIGECVYIGESDKKCAFSRCCNEDSLSYLFAVDNKLSFKYKGVGALENRESLLKEEYRGHPVEFWQDIQRFHDYEEHWNESGLSKEGEEQLERLKKYWK